MPGASSSYRDRVSLAFHNLSEIWRTSGGAHRMASRSILRKARPAVLHEIEAIIDIVLSLEYFRPAELEEVIAVAHASALTAYGFIRKITARPPFSRHLKTACG